MMHCTAGVAEFLVQGHRLQFWLMINQAKVCRVLGSGAIDDWTKVLVCRLVGSKTWDVETCSRETHSPIGSFRKLGVPYFGGLIIRILPI